MSQHDLISFSLDQPIDWGKFEDLVFNILIQDDLPKLSKLGGGADWGVDSEEVAVYADGSVERHVVQVTSQVSQVEKFEATVARLRAKGVPFDTLTMVYRHIVPSLVRREISQKAHDLGLRHVDIRDRSYLVGQLGKNLSVFKRFFANLEDQVAELLGKKDALGVMDDKLRRALLASIAT